MTILGRAEMRAIERRRVLATAIPGPRSTALHARKLAAVFSGVSTGLPVYVERAGGGMIVTSTANSSSIADRSRIVVPRLGGIRESC